MMNNQEVIKSYYLVKRHCLSKLKNLPPLFEYFESWLNETERIEGLIPIKLCRLYGISIQNNTLITSALLNSALALRLINDSKDKLKNSAFLNNAYPNLLFLNTQSLILDTDFDNQSKINFINDIILTSKSVIQSECRMNSKITDFKLYNELVENKTALPYMLLFTFPRHFTNVFKDHLPFWESIAYHFGMMIQLRNDYNSIFREKEYNDLNYNVFSWPVQFGLIEKGLLAEKLKKILPKENNTTRNELIIQILCDMEIGDKMKDRFIRHFNEAENALLDLSQSIDTSFFEELLIGSSRDIDHLFSLKNAIKSPGYKTESQSLNLRTLLKS